MAKEGVKPPDEGTETAAPETTEVAKPSGEQEKGEAKLFTQEQVDGIVSGRVNKLNDKIAQSEKKATVYDNMMNDADVKTFLQNLSEGKKPTYQEEKAADNALEKLQSLDPELAPVIQKVIDQAVAARTGPVNQSVDQLMQQQAKVQADAEMAKLEGSPDKYPWMGDESFKGDMAGFLEGGRANMLEDAYDLAAAGRQRNGQEPPGKVLEKAKTDAELLESEGPGGLPEDDSTKIDPDARYTSVEDCMDSLNKSRGWFKQTK